DVALTGVRTGRARAEDAESLVEVAVAVVVLVVAELGLTADRAHRADALDRAADAVVRTGDALARAGAADRAATRIAVVGRAVAVVVLAVADLRLRRLGAGDHAGRALLHATHALADLVRAAVADRRQDAVVD